MTKIVKTPQLKTYGSNSYNLKNSRTKFFTKLIQEQVFLEEQLKKKQIYEPFFYFGNILGTNTNVN